MKIVKRLLIDEQECGLIEDDVVLSLTRPGRARLRVRSDCALDGLVEIEAGWSETRSHQVFRGYVDSQVTVSAGEQLLFCRELSAALNRDLPLGLRRVTAVDVLDSIAETTKLRFSPASAGYMTRDAPFFHHLGGGYHAMDALGDVYQIPDHIWQQQTDGSIYVGSWGDSRWAEPQRRVRIPDNMFTEHLAHNSARIGMIPAVRPGVLFNRGRITSLRMRNESMVITWRK